MKFKLSLDISNILNRAPVAAAEAVSLPFILNTNLKFIAAFVSPNQHVASMKRRVSACVSAYVFIYIFPCSQKSGCQDDGAASSSVAPLKFGLSRTGSTFTTDNGMVIGERGIAKEPPKSARAPMVKRKNKPKKMKAEFILLKELGRGAGGVVYKAVHVRTLNIVAIKKVASGKGRKHWVLYRPSAHDSHLVISRYCTACEKTN